MTVEMSYFYKHGYKFLDIVLDEWMGCEYAIENLDNLDGFKRFICGRGINNVHTLGNAGPRENQYVKIYPTWLHLDWLWMGPIMLFCFTNFDYYFVFNKVRTPISEDYLRRVISQYLDTASIEASQSVTMILVELNLNKMWYYGNDMKTSNYLDTDAIYSFDLHISGVVWGPGIKFFWLVVDFVFKSLAGFLNADFEVFYKHVPVNKRNLSKSPLENNELRSIIRSENYYSIVALKFEEWISNYKNFELKLLNNLFMYNPIYKNNKYRIFEKNPLFKNNEYDHMIKILNILYYGKAPYKILKLGFVFSYDSISDNNLISTLINTCDYLDNNLKFFDIYITYDIKSVNFGAINNNLDIINWRNLPIIPMFTELYITIRVITHKHNINKKLGDIFCKHLLKKFSHMYENLNCLFVASRLYESEFSNNFIIADIQRFYNKQNPKFNYNFKSKKNKY